MDGHSLREKKDKNRTDEFAVISYNKKLRKTDIGLSLLELATPGGVLTNLFIDKTGVERYPFRIRNLKFPLDHSSLYD